MILMIRVLFCNVSQRTHRATIFRWQDLNACWLFIYFLSQWVGTVMLAALVVVVVVVGGIDISIKIDIGIDIDIDIVCCELRVKRGALGGSKLSFVFFNRVHCRFYNLLAVSFYNLIGKGAITIFNYNGHRASVFFCTFS